MKKMGAAIVWRALGLALPLYLSLLLLPTVGRVAEAAPVSTVAPPAPVAVGKAPINETVGVEQTVPAPGEENSYGTGKASLKVTSSPAGASVYLGSRPLGTTPWTGSDLPTGRFTLRLRLSNHKNIDEPVDLVAGSLVSKNYDLLPDHGSLIVLSSPPGAMVYLDGLDLKRKTPLNLAEVPAGMHLLRVHLDRYYDAEQNVVVVRDSAGLVKFDLRGGHLEACGDKWLESEAAARCRAEEEERKLADLTGEFVQVAGGCFQMGDNFGGGWPDEKPLHEVCVADFAIGKYEVTQKQWLAVMGKNPAYFKGGDNYPVEQVSWTEAQNFISKLNALTGKNFRMTSEAEWEYAARSGGMKELYAGGDDLGALAWYVGNAGSATHAVGTKRANGLGIYDMSGNVAEWVQDWYDGEYYKFSPRSNPVGPLSGCYGRVIRGGGWNVDAALLRTASRDRYEPSNYFAGVGFRLAYSPRK